MRTCNAETALLQEGLQARDWAQVPEAGHCPACQKDVWTHLNSEWGLSTETQLPSRLLLSCRVLISACHLGIL